MTQSRFDTGVLVSKGCSSVRAAVWFGVRLCVGVAIGQLHLASVRCISALQPRLARFIQDIAQHVTDRTSSLNDAGQSSGSPATWYSRC